MTARRRCWFAGIACLLVSLCCWTLATGALGLQQRLWPEEVLRFAGQDDLGSFQNIAALQRGLEAQAEGARLLAWAQSSSIPITLPKTGAARSADVLWVDGESNLLLDLPLLCGDPLSSGDAAGCLLDQSTAAALFGSLDILGREVRLGENSLFVRGVFALPSGLAGFGTNPGHAFCLASAQAAPEDTPVARLHALLPGLSAGDAQDLLLREMASVGLTTSGAFSEDAQGNGLRRWLSGLPGLLFLLLAMLSVCRAARALWRQGLALFRAWRSSRLGCASGSSVPLRLGFAWLLSFAVLCAVFALCLFLLGTSPLPSPAYLPTRWSDFAFWPGVLRRLSQEAAQAQLTTALRPDLLQRWLSLACVLCCAASLLFASLGGHLLRRAAADLPFGVAFFGALPIPFALPASFAPCDFLGFLPALPLWAVPLAVFLPLLLFAEQFGFRPRGRPGLFDRPGPSDASW